MTAINLTNSPSNGDTATVGSLTYTYNSTTSRWELGSPSGSGALSNEQVQDLAGAQLVTNGSHTGISFAYDDSGDGAIDATVGTLNQNTTGSAATLTTPRNIGGVAFDGSADINLPGVNAAGTQNTTGSAVTLTTPREINGVAFNGSADITVPAGGVTVYATMALLIAVTGMSAGNMAYVTANNNLYMYTGTGWFKVATVSNNSPSAITGVGATTALATDGTATVITAVSTDPEGFPLTWSYSVTTGSLTNGGGASATVSQADNVFTITPTTTEAYAGTFSITFSATDGTNAVTAASAFTLAFGYDWTATTQQAKMQASDAQAEDYFGRSSAISGDTVVVSAHYEDAGGTDAGAAYVFTRSGTTWSQQAKLTASDAEAGDYFGISSNIDGDTVVVGAYSEDSGGSWAGAAYIYTRSGTTWSEQAKLTASDAQAGDYFGVHVAISGNTVVVGAWGEDTGGSQSGAAYVFTRSGTTWSQQAKLTASDAQADDNLGYWVCIDGDTVVVGAHNEDAGGTDAGAAYVFTRSGTTWTQQQKLASSDIAAGDYFGRCSAISGDTVVVGAYGDDHNYSSAGAAYVFTRSGTTWTQQAKLTASDPEADDYFGFRTAIDGDTVLVGAYSEDTGGSNAGAAYIFTRSGTTWTQDKKIVASDGGASDNFGYGLGIDEDTLVVSAPYEDSTANNAGAAYVFIAG